LFQATEIITNSFQRMFLFKTFSMIVLKLCPYLYTEGRVDDTKYIKKKYLKGVGIHLKY